MQHVITPYITFHITPNMPCNTVYNTSHKISNWSSSTSSVGVPRTFKTQYSCSMSVSPGNKGELLSISPKIHPTAHMSTAESYNLAPYKSSGARYHLVATFQITIPLLKYYFLLNTILKDLHCSHYHI